MAWRITDSLIKAELDNRTPGEITGTLELHGNTTPIRIQLAGNFQSDIAGCVLTVVNPNPLPAERTNLDPMQFGTAGEMTASRKVRITNVSVKEAMRLMTAGKPVPGHWDNAVYLEWFSDRDGRVVIESSGCTVTISPPAWKIPAAETQPLPDAKPESGLDEFAWEQFLQECDSRTELYAKLLEQYEGHPDRDEKIATEMGWQELHEVIEEFDDFELDPENIIDDEDLFPEAEPDPAQEGKTWIRTEDNRIVHPLYQKAHILGIELWTMCDEADLLFHGEDQSVDLMIHHAHDFSIKLAGALNCLYMEDDFEDGFVIALLKRSLPVFNDCMEAMDQVVEEQLIPAEVLAPYRKRLHTIRQEVIQVMEDMRK